jgi:D-alanine transaminase
MMIEGMTEGMTEAKMQELIWINGQIMPLGEAHIAVEDRGFQFADGVYEVIRIYGGKMFALGPHLDRLERSCAGISVQMPIKPGKLAGEMREFVDRSAVRDGSIYLQISRGASPRNPVFPVNATPTLLFYVRSVPPLPAIGAGPGASLLSVPDERWHRCWIKSTALLANILARNAAAERGCDEAVFVDGEMLSECGSSNLFIVSGNQLVTAPVGPRVLPGITREILLDLAAKLGIETQVRPVQRNEALSAAEVFICSTMREINWASRWDGRTVGDGTCGAITRRLHQAIRKAIASECNL